MLDHAMEAMAMVQGKKRSDLNNDRMMELSLVRLVEIIGEAAARVEPIAEKNTLPFPGSKLSGCATGLFTATMLLIWTCFGIQLQTIFLR